MAKPKTEPKTKPKTEPKTESKPKTELLPAEKIINQVNQLYMRFDDIADEQKHIIRELRNLSIQLLTNNK